MELKFPSEHRLDSMDYEGELLIYHTLMLNHDECSKYDFKQLFREDWKEKTESENTQLIVSFMISSDPNSSEEVSGKLWHELAAIQSINGKVDQLNSNSNLMQKEDYMDLMKIVNNGLRMGFRKSFYYYRGSLSVPNCKNVERIVMKEGVRVN